MMALPLKQPERASDDTNRGFPRSSWNGHRVDTRAGLITIFQCAMRTGRQFTLPQRALMTACKFWVLAMRRELHLRTSPRAIAALEFAGIAYDSIGVPGVAEALRDAHRDLIVIQRTANRRQRLTQLEDQLLLSANAVDTLLERVATELAATDVVTEADRDRSATSSHAAL
jgi:hypothetical protein